MLYSVAKVVLHWLNQLVGRRVLVVILDGNDEVNGLASLVWGFVFVWHFDGY